MAKRGRPKTIDSYLKSDIRKAIKEARTLHLCRDDGIVNVIYHERGKDLTGFIKDALKKEFNKLIIFHNNGGKTEIEVLNAVQ